MSFYGDIKRGTNPPGCCPPMAPGPITGCAPTCAEYQPTDEVDLDLAVRVEQRAAARALGDWRRESGSSVTLGLNSRTLEIKPSETV